jgi:malate dehydrogenase
MTTVAIIGAGELGASAAQALAARDRVACVLLVDDAAEVAAGKALDIRQMGAVEGFHTRLEGTGDRSRITGCAVCVVADRVGRPSGEWRGEEGAAMLSRLVPYLGDAPLVFAGADQDDLLLSAFRDLRLPRARLLGSAPDAFAAAVASIVAMEAQASPGEVVLSALGAPRALVVPLAEASLGGYALERVLTQVQLSRIEARAARLWPPGPYALGAAAARVVEALVHDGRRSHSVMTVLDGEFGVRNRAGVLPALLGSGRILQSRVPTLNTREQVRLATSLGAP